MLLQLSYPCGEFSFFARRLKSWAISRYSSMGVTGERPRESAPQLAETAFWCVYSQGRGLLTRGGLYRARGEVTGLAVPPNPSALVSQAVTKLSPGLPRKKPATV